MARKTPQSRTPLARMLRIHNAFMDDGYPNCSSLAKDFEVSSKTIQRDIDYMRDQLNLPINYDMTRHGYHYTEAVTHFPTIPATEGEVLALFVAQKALEQYRGTPFEGPLSQAFSKLSQVMEDEISVNLGQLTTALSFHHTGMALTNLEIFQKVTKALMDRKELEFVYKKLNATRSEKRRVQPYHLGSFDGQWYLFAYDLARKDIRTFVIGRIQKITTVGKKFKKPENFSLARHLVGAFGVFRGEGDFKVRIEFDAFAAQLVRERTWHPTQVIKDLPGDALELAMRLDSLEEIQRWILSWGRHAKVQAPVALKRRVKEALKDMENLYQDAPPWLFELNELAQAHQPDRLLQMVMAMDRGPEHPDQMSLGFLTREG